MFRSEFIKHDDRLFILKKTLPANLNPNLDYWKERLGADTVLLKEGIYYLVEEIPTIDFVETLNEKQ